MASDLDWRDEQRELAGILGRHLRSHAEGEALAGRIVAQVQAVLAGHKATPEQPELPGFEGLDDERRLLERRAARRIKEGLAAQLAAALPEGTTEQTVAGAEQRAIAANQVLRDGLYSSLVEGALLGVDIARQQVEVGGISVDWTLVNIGARDWAQQYAGTLVTQIDEVTARAIGKAVAGWIENTLTYDELLKQIGDLAGPERAERIASTEITRAYAEGSREAWAASGSITLMRWRTSQDERVCDVCGSLDGQVVQVIGGEFVHPGGEGLEKLAGTRYANPPAHPRCLPGDTRVLAEGVAATSERWYDGDLVVIRTAGGKQLASTPNHPILTPAGWVAAGLLDVGGHVISILGSQGVASGSDLDNKDMPARIQDIAEAFRRSEQVAAVPVPLAAEDFHGDGIGSEVAIIRTNGLLGDGGNAPLVQEGSKQVLSGRCMQATALDGGSMTDLADERDSTAASCRVCGRHLAGAVAIRHASPLERFGLALPANDDIGGKEPLANSPTIDIEGFGDGVLGFAGKIAPDQIVGVERQAFHGYVYNLQTASECYVAEGIITHNCRCWVVPETGKVR